MGTDSSSLTLPLPQHSSLKRALKVFLRVRSAMEIFKMGALKFKCRLKIFGAMVQKICLDMRIYLHSDGFFFSLVKRNTKGTSEGTKEVSDQKSAIIAYTILWYVWRRHIYSPEDLLVWTPSFEHSVTGIHKSIGNKNVLFLYKMGIKQSIVIIQNRGHLKK